MTTLVENTPAAWSERAAHPASWSAGLMSERGQTQRFLAILRHLELRRGDTLFDYGCGTARLCEFLPSGVEYFGYDWAEGLRQRAREEHPRARILDTEPRFAFDHVVANGPFSLADNWSYAKTWNALGELWDQTTHTLVCTLYRGEDASSLVYVPESLAAFARKVGCTRYVIDASYLDNDLMLVMRR